MGSVNQRYGRLGITLTFREPQRWPRLLTQMAKAT